MNGSGFSRTVGQRKTRPITFNATAENLISGCAFNDAIHAALGHPHIGMPKGVYYFKNHEEANAHQEYWLAKHMARIAK